jgi:hypothetical protein
MGLKEQALYRAMGPAMNMVQAWTKDICPENEIARFVESHFGGLFEMPGEGSDQVNSMAPLLVKIMIFHANDSPDLVEAKLLRFYEDFRKFYRELAERRREGEMA